jgi:integrase
MNQTLQAISPLRQRMIDDMRMRQLSPRTQANYLRIVREFSRYHGRSPDTATVEDLRGYQLHLVDHGTSPVSLNAAITGLKFFFGITLHEPELMARMQPVRVPRTLPVVLSPDEVRRLIIAAGNLKHQTALSVAYGAGLRASEVVALKVGDIDSQRMTLRIERGKGRKDRYAMLSPVLLERLRVWWRVAHAQGRMLDGGWLFPGHDPVDPLSAVHAAAEAAHIDKRVSMHKGHPMLQKAATQMSACIEVQSACLLSRYCEVGGLLKFVTVEHGGAQTRALEIGIVRHSARALRMHQRKLRNRIDQLHGI